MIDNRNATTSFLLLFHRSIHVALRSSSAKQHSSRPLWVSRLFCRSNWSTGSESLHRWLSSVDRRAMHPSLSSRTSAIRSDTVRNWMSLRKSIRSIRASIGWTVFLPMFHGGKLRRRLSKQCLSSCSPFRSRSVLSTIHPRPRSLHLAMTCKKDRIAYQGCFPSTTLPVLMGRVTSIDQCVQDCSTNYQYAGILDG